MFKQQGLTLKQILDSMPEPAPEPGHIRFAGVVVNEASRAAEIIFLPVLAFFVGIALGIGSAYRKVLEQYGD